MTVFLPLEADAPFPQGPSFLTSSSEPSAHVKRVVKAIMKARRIAVVCGAGISVQAGIPDFRSSDGLFQSLKKDNPTLSSGKDLFDASVFNSEVTTSLFCQMIAQLSEMSEAALPTSFHELLRALDDRRKLLRVYTQNIDALESKSGLTFGVPEVEGKRHKPRSKGKNDGTDEAAPAPAAEATSSRLPSPPIETPRCIPLHGTLQLMHCQTCTHSFPLRDYLAALASGHPPYCPECTALEETRQLVGKRSRGVGKLRPSVVLYNEVHKDGEEVGAVVRRDLVGGSKGKGRAGADLLLVVGTSLRVPGTKRIVREFSKAVRARASPAGAPPVEPVAVAPGLATPTPSPRRSPAVDEEPPIKAVYLNLDFPVPTREWEGVFDVWIRGDAQDFARIVLDEMEKEERTKEAAVVRKRRREEAAVAAQLAESEQVSVATPGKKRKGAPVSETRPQPTKKRKYAPITPVSRAKPKAASKTKKPVSSILPTAPPAHAHSKTKLTIKIPPRPVITPLTPPRSKRVRLVPEVVISSRQSILETPPDSPLTPLPSPSPPRRTSSTPKGTGKRKPVTRKKPPSARELRAGADDNFKGQRRQEKNGHVFDSDSQRDSSPLTGADSSDDLNLSSSLIRTTSCGLRVRQPRIEPLQYDRP